jgi:hypothetical protein
MTTTVHGPLLTIFGRGLGWVRRISRETGPYLTRWSLRQQWGDGASHKNGGHRVYLHRFFSADSELHNHPWHWSFSIVLWGSYDEYYFDGEPGRTSVKGQPAEVYQVRRVRWFNWIPSARFHQITTLHPGPGGAVLTLFVCGSPHGQSWGFWVPGRGVIPHLRRKQERDLLRGSS